MVVVRGSQSVNWPSLDCFKKMVNFCSFFARKTLQQMCVAVAVAVGNSFWYQKMRQKKGLFNSIQTRFAE
jgi:hypothetical protein